MKEKEPSPPMAVEFPKLTLEPHTLNWIYMVDSPDRGRIKIELSNYSDQVKTFKISVSEDTSGL